MIRITAVALLAASLSCARGDSGTDVEDLGSSPGSNLIDPGPRGGTPGAGGALAALDADHTAYFGAAQAVFAEIDSVSGGIAGEEGSGLGPTFNANSCASCHAEPAAGGSSPHPTMGFVKKPNPQIGFASLDRLPGQSQMVPSFILSDGPVREARFVKNPDGTNDGGVHGLYTVAGRIDAPECKLAQPDFATQLKKSNVIFRIPTPFFGAGLLEAITDATLNATFAATASARAQAGIAGRFNHSGNDGTITRFGWKAQNKSLLIFAGEAYNVEQGVTSELFPNERGASPNCNLNPNPEDPTHMGAAGTPSAASADVVNFAAFGRMLAAPAATTASASELNGSKVFVSVGCALCHTTALTTDASSYSGDAQTIHPYSDLAIHHMGPGLADGISQGAAAGDEFRTAPLWGVGQRIFFLHDGRAGPKNGGLVAAINAHFSGSRNCPSGQFTDSSGNPCQSEANQVIQKFYSLPNSSRQDVVNFLRSL
jgi:CxxC motif-containing protein (DUF1111 family)